MAEFESYEDELRKTKSLAIVAALQKHRDTKAVEEIAAFSGDLNWEPLDRLLISSSAWEHVKKLGVEPKFVFCHPELIRQKPLAALYYRGLSGMSQKAANQYCGTIGNIELGTSKPSEEKALKMARAYNAFTSTVIENSADWTLENGKRAVIATLGITLDGTMRNKIGEIAEKRVRAVIVEWLIDHDLIISPSLNKDDLLDDENIPRELVLKNGIRMVFRPEPDVSFLEIETDTLLAVVEIKGGTDPAGALERYGAATKSFQSAIKRSTHCKNFYLGAVFTSELERRIAEDRLVEKTYGIIDILTEPDVRESFLRDLFHFTLRLPV